MGRIKTGRNEPCACGSGIKAKRCHGEKWQPALAFVADVWNEWLDQQGQGRSVHRWQQEMKGPTVRTTELIEEFKRNLMRGAVVPCSHCVMAALAQEPMPVFVEFSNLNSLYCPDCWLALCEHRKANWDERWQRTCDLCGYWEPEEIYPLITTKGPISFVGGKCKACRDTHKHVAALNDLPNLRGIAR